MATITKNAELLNLLEAAESDEVARLALSDCLEELGAEDMAGWLRDTKSRVSIEVVRSQCLARKLICWRDLPEYAHADRLLSGLESADWNELPEHEGRISVSRLRALSAHVLESLGVGAEVSSLLVSNRVVLRIVPRFPSTATHLDAKELLERLIACVFPDHADRFEVH